MKIPLISDTSFFEHREKIIKPENISGEIRLYRIWLIILTFLFANSFKFTT
jgi:hypothetical protein